MGYRYPKPFEISLPPHHPHNKHWVVWTFHQCRYYRRRWVAFFMAFILQNGEKFVRGFGNRRRHRAEQRLGRAVRRQARDYPNRW